MILYGTYVYVTAVSCTISYSTLLFSVADPGCVYRIPDPNFSIPDADCRVKKIPDPDPHKRI